MVKIVPVVYNRGECLPSSLAAHDWHQEFNCQPVVLSKGLHFLLRAHDWHQDYHSQPVVYNRGECLPSSLAAHDWHQEFNCQPVVYYRKDCISFFEPMTGLRIIIVSL
ncbi:hypothetical protein DAPPUDRAFT_334074 [Daphnia pulex]|uniref:Uncharacterized protein n=1 Tax=Daphnia pulex TaxID=6669 RepID=E9HUL4_DAPPU|nr:hypothetical protein DAPPUDRAFT_334074 [Daphnia pulex]|eukprot:EFX64567.1 hypothetical protein DAPPUDRAFT_334074 [Daphnia pulex]